MRIHYGYLFSTADLFTSYVNHFYSKKAQATGGERYLIKLLLNGLYGYFGRNPYNPSALIVTQNELLELLSKHPIRSIIELTKELTLINYYPNKTNTTNKTLNIRPTLSNVAIASAITANSRVFINPFKCNPKNPCLYSDTDSVFLQYSLPSELIGNGLGQFKDELNGGIITRGLFLRPKCYGFETNTGIQKVVAAGFEKNELKLTDLESIIRGETVTHSRTILLRDNIKLTLTQKELTRTLTLN